MRADQRGANGDCRWPPAHPAIRQCHPPWISSSNGKMPCRIKCEGTNCPDTHRTVAIYFFRPWICTRINCQDRRLPSIVGKIARELERSVYPTPTAKRWKVIRNHQNFFHEEMVLLKS